MTQIQLFEAHLTTRHAWELSRDGAREAADVLVELLRAGTEVVTFSAIVKHKLGLSGDSVPDKMARAFADQVDAVYERRDYINAIVADTGEFQLTVVDALGRPAIRGGDPCGYAIRQSEAGARDTMAQVAMSTGKLRAVAKRQRLAGMIDQQTHDTLIGTVDQISRRLLPEATDVPA